MRTLRVLVGCESSGTVREAFRALGHDAWSCDLLPADDGSPHHIQGDVIAATKMAPWDLLIAHPPCTRLCNSGVRWLKVPPAGRTYEEMWEELRAGAKLFSGCLNADVPHVAVENPVMHRYAKDLITGYRPAAQHVQPWWFGEEAFKATGLYLRNLPKLVPTNRLVPPTRGTPEHKAWSVIHMASPGADRWKTRSKTFQGIADAMAYQWSDFICQRERQAA